MVASMHILENMPVGSYPQTLSAHMLCILECTLHILSHLQSSKLNASPLDSNYSFFSSFFANVSKALFRQTFLLPKLFTVWYSWLHSYYRKYTNKMLLKIMIFFKVSDTYVAKLSFTKRAFSNMEIIITTLIGEYFIVLLKYKS